MKTSIQIDPDQKEPHIVIHTSQITPEIEQLLSLLSASPLPLCVLQDERIVPVQPDDLYMVRVENGQTRLYTKQEIFTCKKRLYEVEELLGPSWIRISKTTLINIRHIDYVEPSFGTALLLKLKNGQQDYVSRKYLPAFKKAIGL